MAFKDYLTAEGERLLNKSISESLPVTFTRLVMGSGYLAQGTNEKNVTDVVIPIKELPIETVTLNDSTTTVITVSYTNDDLEEGFFFREKAIYMKVGEEEVIGIYGNAGNTAEYIDTAKVCIVEKMLRTVLELSSDEVSNITLNSGNAVTKEDFQAFKDSQEQVQEQTQQSIAALEETQNSMNEHTTSKSNPHGVTKSQIGLGNVENKSSATIRGELTQANVTNALGYTPLDNSKKGVSNGVAELDANGKVPSSQLPSYVDDVVEAQNKSGFPSIGESGKIYVETSTNKTYRWSGSTYVEISASLALGENSSTAYRGDRGKTAYDHSQETSGNPHGVTKEDVGLGNVPNVATNNQTPTYSAASSNSALVSGETLSVAFGKIAKAISSLISHLTTAATSSVLGHVKLSDTYSSKASNGAAANGLGASQNALYNAYNTLNTKVTTLENNATIRYVNDESDANYGWMQYKDVDGTWVNWKFLGVGDNYIIQNGMYNHEIYPYSLDDMSVEEQGNGVRFFVNYDGQKVAFCSLGNIIDFSKYSNVKMNISSLQHGYDSDAGRCTLYVVKSKDQLFSSNITNDSNVVAKLDLSVGSKEFNVSAINGNYYLCLRVINNSATQRGHVTFTDLHLE